MTKKKNNHQDVNPGKSADQETDQALKETINGYFDYLAQFPGLEAFKDDMQSCIDKYMKADHISSDQQLEDLSKLFKSSDIPQTPQSLSEYAAFLKEKIVPHAVNVGKSRYIGHMTSMLPLFYQYIAQLVTSLNQNNVKVETSKVFTLIERQTLAMLHRLVYNLPESFYKTHIQLRESNLGIITSCGTLANITAMWIARNKALQSSGEFQGLQSEGFTNALKHYGYKDAVIIGSAKMHYSMDKLGSLIGLGAENILKIGLNSSGSIDIDELKETIEACQEEKRLIVAVVGIAGTTETGQIDDLPFMSKVCKEYDIHFHVDAAWGGPILFSDKHRHLLKGIETADSVTICGHKQLYLPQGISIVLCKDPRIIYHIKAIAGYQARAESYDLGKHSPEGSRPATCTYLHAGLHLIGKQGYAYLIDEGIRKAKLYAEMIRKHPAFELMEEPATNIVVYRFIPDEMRHKTDDMSFNNEDQYVINSINEVLQDQQFLAGTTFISRSTLFNTKYGFRIPIVVMRAVLANPLTTEKDLETVLEDQLTTGDIVLKQRSMSFAQVLKLLYHQTSSFNRQ